MKRGRRIDSHATRANLPGQTCDRCTRPIRVGELIVMTRFGWAHHHCSDEPGEL